MRLFDWRTNHVFINNVELTNYADGNDALGIKRAADIGTHKMDLNGKMHLSLSADKSGEVVVKLMATSPSNAYLNKLASSEDSVETFVPVSFRWYDAYRNDEAKGSIGYIKRPVDIVRGKEIVEQEWTFVVQDLYSLLGAPSFAGLPSQIAEGI
jgi:hypothetical protein